jgi:hypothetical protein
MPAYGPARPDEEIAMLHKVTRMRGGTVTARDGDVGTLEDL